MAKTKQPGKNTAAAVEALVRPTLTQLGFALWDVRYEKEGPNWYLRILIDHADGSVMDTDACETASRAVEPLIDEADPIEQSYFLEVGSPGLGRRLTRPEHFAACEGREVTVRLIHADAAREVTGMLERSAGGWLVRPAGGEPLLIDAGETAFVKLNDDADL